MPDRMCGGDVLRAAAVAEVDDAAGDGPRVGGGRAVGDDLRAGPADGGYLQYGGERPGRADVRIGDHGVGVTVRGGRGDLDHVRGARLRRRGVRVLGGRAARGDRLAAVAEVERVGSHVAPGVVHRGGSGDGQRVRPLRRRHDQIDDSEGVLGFVGAAVEVADARAGVGHGGVVDAGVADPVGGGLARSVGVGRVDRGRGGARGPAVQLRISLDVVATLSRGGLEVGRGGVEGAGERVGGHARQRVDDVVVHAGAGDGGRVDADLGAAHRRSDGRRARRGEDVVLDAAVAGGACEIDGVRVRVLNGVSGDDGAGGVCGLNRRTTRSRQQRAVDRGRRDPACDRRQGGLTAEAAVGDARAAGGAAEDDGGRTRGRAACGHAILGEVDVRRVVDRDHGPRAVQPQMGEDDVVRAVDREDRPLGGRQAGGAGGREGDRRVGGPGVGHRHRSCVGARGDLDRLARLCRVGCGLDGAVGLIGGTGAAVAAVRASSVVDRQCRGAGGRGESDEADAAGHRENGEGGQRPYAQECLRRIEAVSVVTGKGIPAHAGTGPWDGRRSRP